MKLRSIKDAAAKRNTTTIRRLARNNQPNGWRVGPSGSGTPQCQKRGMVSTAQSVGDAFMQSCFVKLIMRTILLIAALRRYF